MLPQSIKPRLLNKPSSLYIKRCALCGHDAHLFELEVNHSYYIKMVSCNNPECKVYESMPIRSDTKSTAVSKWNSLSPIELKTITKNF